MALQTKVSLLDKCWQRAGLFLGLSTSVDAYVIYPITQVLAIIWLANSIVGLMIAGAVFAAICVSTLRTCQNHK